MSTDPLAFAPGVAEKLGWYVYALRDPRDGLIFYIGKGRGDRVYQHARSARRVGGETDKQLKLSRIRAIHKEGQEVSVEIVRHLIENEPTAYEVESAVIDALRLTGAELTNLTSGHGRARGWQPFDELIAEYAAKKIPIEHPVVLIRINELYRPGMTDTELYKATREWWAMAPETRSPKWAFAVYDGIVRAVYRIESWEQEPQGVRKRRWAFTGMRDYELEAHYVWADVREYLPRGAANPIRYVNC